MRCSGECAADSGTTTNRPPCNKEPQISSTEASKAYECHCAQVCPARNVAGDPISAVTL
ncbi:Uncharacterised protein [Mycobacteroides abscessus subsp. abscessus]|nr:Uncharacterised protein [Mycobacteroides abscessus subsp. abscessus]